MAYTCKCSPLYNLWALTILDSSITHSLVLLITIEKSVIRKVEASLIFNTQKLCISVSSCWLLKNSRWTHKSDCWSLNKICPWARKTSAEKTNLSTNISAYWSLFFRTHTNRSFLQSWGCWLPGKNLHLHSHGWHWFPSNRDKDGERRDQAVKSHMLSNYKWRCLPS